MSREIEIVLGRLAEGGNEALRDLYPLVYADLQRVARAQLARERPDHTLNTTALVHESYLRLAGGAAIDAEGRSHFLSIAARAMRRILVDHARRRNAQKRGGGAPRPSMTLAAHPPHDVRLELLDLDTALHRLESLDARQARVVECRVFGGMTIEETADVLGTSPATVKRDWTLARAWLNREVRPG